MNKKILMISHSKEPDSGRIDKYLKNRKINSQVIKVALGEKLPQELNQYNAIIIFGGLMSANDDKKLPHIKDEIEWINHILNSRKPLLGICLGAQLLARSLGGQVYEHPEKFREIGYHKIDPTKEGEAIFDKDFYVYHWHKEGFSVPKDCTLLAKGKMFENQAFIYGKNAYGIQFHPEVTLTQIIRWTGDDIGKKHLKHIGAQQRSEQVIKNLLYTNKVEKWLEKFLDEFILTKDN